FRNEIFWSVTQVVFLSRIFPKVKHIVVDEAQNFQSEGNWHQCAWELVKKKSGIFWVFLDFVQFTHTYGLERRIVFGIHPVPAGEEISLSFALLQSQTSHEQA
uniref:Uncharacterized protein n=1 Tax=Falco tinnunculus TaxID=100819 RepID=A0A8C4V190_FALTI